MTLGRAISAAVFALVLTLGAGGALAQQSSSSQELINDILQDVIDRTIAEARKEVRRNTGIDPLERGYDPSKSYEPVSKEASEETRRELAKLNEEHDRTIRQLEEELDRKLTKADEEFRREAGKEDKPEKIKEKRKKLEKKVDEAYDKFEEKIAEENRRYDEKRDQILSKS